MLVSPANAGVVECNLVKAFFRLKNDSKKGSLARVHIVDDKMEVERKMRVQGVAKLFVLGVAMRNRRPKHTIFFHKKKCSATRLWAFQLAKSLVSSRCLTSQLRWRFNV